MNLVGQWTEHPAVEEKRAVRGRRGRVGERDSPLLSAVPFLFFSPLPLLPKWQQVRLIQRRGSITMTATDRLSGERQASSNIRPYRIGPGGRGGWSDRAAGARADA